MVNVYSVVAGYVSRGQGAGPMMVTLRGGIFAKHGLRVETRLINGSGSAVKSLMEGKIQFGNFAAPALLRADLKQGADLVYLTGGINQQFLIGRPEVETLQQLSGGRIGLVGDGGFPDFLVQFIAGDLIMKMPEISLLQWQK
ncbi:ABC transporter substrate-binding protein, partial [Thermodesulfobacteriota bacterium]